jgi:hypothetical protein
VQVGGIIDTSIVLLHNASSRHVLGLLTGGGIAGVGRLHLLKNTSTDTIAYSRERGPVSANHLQYAKHSNSRSQLLH